MARKTSGRRPRHVYIDMPVNLQFQRIADRSQRQVEFGFGTSRHYLEAADPLRNGTPYSTALYFM
eukprot:scaffold127549_cov19-Prasinocladus_malaysianus.AAC.1